MQRYWDLKRKSMDALLFYRFGDWYVLYYDDLDICNKLLSLCVTPHIGMHQIGFHSRDLAKNVKIMTKAGNKVAVCEQQETRQQMVERTSKKNQSES